MSGNVMDHINRKAYSSPAAAKFYDRMPTLFDAEQIILKELAQAIRNKKLLDIGIGGGRTTPFLLEISADYTGIDYSPMLVERAKRRFGIETFYECDVREMRGFANSTFDFALFSFNGLDSISHEDRQRALREIYRVLKPDGSFVFSAHNREWKNVGKPLWAQEDAHWTLRFVKSCIWAFLFQPRHWWLRRFELHEKHYAIINDGGLRYSVLNYYIDLSSQIAQLRECGFNNARAYDMHGRMVTYDRDSPWLYYVARKSSGQTT